MVFVLVTLNYSLSLIPRGSSVPVGTFPPQLLLQKISLQCRRNLKPIRFLQLLPFDHGLTGTFKRRVLNETV